MQFISKIVDKTEIIVTILVGISSVLIAYTSYTANLWDGNSLENYSKSNQMINEANTTYIESVVRSNQNTSDADFDQFQKDYDGQKADADTLSDVADTANKHGDTYSLFSAIIAAIMFMLSLATIMHSRSAKFGIITFSALMIFGIIIKVALLPRPA